MGAERVAGLPRVVSVRRPTEYEELLATHGTHGQAEFFLRTRGRRMDEVVASHRAQEAAVAAVFAAIPRQWRRAQVVRSDLDRFLFEPEDIVVPIGQDGLVANVAKYLSGQVVVGVNPEPGRFDGVLVRHAPAVAPRVIAAVVEGRARVQVRTMVEALADDGQRVIALNEVYLGHRSHQSARWTLTAPASPPERQSSSGLVVATGTGSTGWAASLHRSRGTAPPLPTPGESVLAWFVREAFPSRTTGTTRTEGRLEPGDELQLSVEMGEGGVMFGDGIESDAVPLRWGMRVSVRAARETLRLA